MEQLKEQLTKAVKNIAEFWKKIEPKRQKMILAAGGVLLSAAVVLVIYLNMAAARMVALYPVLSTSETAAVSTVLAEMGVPAQINSKGEIMVPAGTEGELLLQLAAKGYPQSAPVYNTFLENSGLTKTESEKQQLAIYQTQENIRASLIQSKGVKNATVLLSIPQNSGYVWDKNSGESSASLTITMEPGQELTPERAMAIKNLVAFSVSPQMDPDNVKVIDAATGIEVLPSVSELDSLTSSARRLEFEAQVQKRMEDNVRRLLTPIYGPGGVTVVASVTLDYDKMLTQQHQIIPGDDGNGVKQYVEEQYTVDGKLPSTSVVGENNNTDTPIYPDAIEENGNETTSINRVTEWENSYIDTQIEKGEAILKEATVSVVVQDSNFDQQKQEDLIEMVSKAVNLGPESISVKNFDPNAGIQDVDTQPGVAIDQRIIIVAAVAGVILIILIILLVVVFKRKRKTKAEAAAQAQIDEAERKKREELEEIERHKRELAENAQAATDSKEAAITQEIQKFAKENPEITASLIRSILKEDE